VNDLTKYAVTWSIVVTWWEPSFL